MARVATAVMDRARTSPGTFALLAWIVLNAADALITWTSFGLGAVEGNPLLADLQRSVGAGPMLMLKMAAAMAVGVLVLRWGRLSVLKALDVLMLLVVLYNLGVVAYVVR